MQWENLQSELIQQLMWQHRNIISAQRKESVEKAYLNCHTDITIPYDELGSIRTIDDEGDMISIIEDGRFVLPGTEALNEPFGE